MEYSYKILEEKLKSLPFDLQAALVSVDTANKVGDIAEKHSLHIDQAGALAEVTSFVMLGLIPSKNFVSELVVRAEIKTEEAAEIAKEVNAEIFNSIRQSLQKIQYAEKIPEDTNASLEKAGGFTIEKQPETLEAYAQKTDDSAVTAIDREKALNAIENPTFHNAGPVNVLTRNGPDIADHMLAAPTIQKTAIEVKKPETKAPQQLPKIDPYREQV